MQHPPAELAAWQSFYTMTGEASATLIGLLFVAASVGSSIFNEERQHGLRVFLSPTVVHFSSVLGACLIMVAPLPNAMAAAILVTAEGVFGLAYSALVVRRMVRHQILQKIDAEDRLYYSAAPAFAYLLLCCTGITLLRHLALGCDMLAGTITLLLLVGIRNAWDITTWAVIRRES